MSSETPTLLDVHNLVVRLMPLPEDGTRDEIAAWEHNVGREMALYSSLDPERRPAVGERLKVISDLPPADLRRTRDVLDAAKRLGVGQSVMYDLIRRVAEHGPVSGLVPGRRMASKPSAARDGFGSPIDDWIAAAMSEQPDIAIADVSRWIDACIEGLVSTGGQMPRVPAMSALRERVHALRSRRPEMIAPLEAGVDLLIDQCPLNLTIETDSGRRGATGLFIVDQRTTLILGVGISVGPHADTGLAMAIRDLDGRIRSLTSHGLVLSRQPTSVLWIVPSALAPQLISVRNTAMSVPELGLRCRLERSGTRLRKLIGDRLGPYRLIPRVIPDATSSDPAVTKRFIDIDAADFRIAFGGLSFEVGKRNARLLEDMAIRSDSLHTSGWNSADYVGALHRVFECFLEPR